MTAGRTNPAAGVMFAHSRACTVLNSINAREFCGFGGIPIAIARYVRHLA